MSKRSSGEAKPNDDNPETALSPESPLMARCSQRLGGVTGKGFLPGQSGNPAGRAPGERRLLQKKYGKDGERLFEALEELRLDPKTPARVKLDALIFLVERLYGRAQQRVEVDATGDVLNLVLVAARIAEEPGGTR